MVCSRFGSHDPQRMNSSIFVDRLIFAVSQLQAFELNISLTVVWIDKTQFGALVFPLHVKNNIRWQSAKVSVLFSLATPVAISSDCRFIFSQSSKLDHLCDIVGQLNVFSSHNLNMLSKMERIQTVTPKSNLNIEYFNNYKHVVPPSGQNTSLATTLIHANITNDVHISHSCTAFTAK